MNIIGIDPGVTTGIAVWNTDTQAFELVTSATIHRAFKVVEDYLPALVVFEDARLRKWFGNSGREQLQGAGSVKRDCKAWEDFLTDTGIGFHKVSPQSKGKKVGADDFKLKTKWGASTNEHARDAAMLVFGMTSGTVTRIKESTYAKGI